MNAFYFKINLNKFGEKRIQVLAEQKLFKNIVLIFAILTIVIYGAILYYNHQLEGKLENRRQLLNSIRQEIESYREVGEYLSTNDLERLARSSTDRIFWANKLIALADIVTEKIAITHFSFRRGELTLFGITQVDVEEREFDLIYDFIENLKDNPQISGDFDEIKFERAHRDKEKDIDIIRFEITCIGRSVARRR